MTLRKIFCYILGAVGLCLMAYGVAIAVFDAIFPPAPPPRGWSPPKGNVDKIIYKLKRVIDQKIDELTSS